jgi:hypothetical protein
LRRSGNGELGMSSETFVLVCLILTEILKSPHAHDIEKLSLLIEDVRNRTLTLIEREDDTRSWGNFLIYFSHSTTMSYPPRGWRYILIGC